MAAKTRSRWGRHGARHGAGDDDEEEAATIASVGEKRRVGAHQTRIVMKLRKNDAVGDVPWVTELVCMFFNAQGDVLRIHRANQSNASGTALPPTASGGGADSGPSEYDVDVDPITLHRFDAKDAVEKERLSVSLAAVHPSVEVVGFLATYATDEIARRPQLNAFQVTCDASIDTYEEEDELLRGSQAGGGAPTRLYFYTHEPSSGLPFSNYVVLCKFFRDPDCRSEWICHTIGASGIVRSSVNAALAQAMQVFLLDIIPEIEIAHRNALNTVASICAALSRDEVLVIEEYFDDDGVTRDEFAKLLLLALLASRPEMRRLSRATALVALLFEMFEQIDINGDGAVDWEEFTSFCVSLGLIATKEQKLGSSTVSGCAYRQQLVGPATRTFPYQIRRIRSFPSLRLIAVIQNKCSNILMYDPKMKFLHEFNHVSRLAQESSSNASLAILDIEYVTTRNWLVVSSNDHVLTFWSVVNAATGAYVYAFKIGSRAPIPQLYWCGTALNRLVTISSEGVQLWDVEGRRVASRLTHHHDRITACIEVDTETPLLATCSFDNTIAFLHVPSLTPAFELRGHVQGIQHMDYRAHGGLLLSCGFEHQAYCWNVTSQLLLTTLGGHQSSLIGARFVSTQSKSSTVVVVTGDERGHFRLWDISRCLLGHTIDAAAALQSFDVVTPNLCNFHTFAIGMSSHTKKSDESQELVDIVTGAFRLFRFHAVTHLDESAPPRHVAFNSISNNFVGSVDGVITVWSANSGAKVEEPITVREFDVCAIAFDMPRQRKLFVATSDGAIRLYNPITAILLTKTVVHDGTISSLNYCPRSSCLVSTGHDRRIAVSFSSAGKTEIDVLRTVENAHDSCITCAAYSQDLELVATGDDVGNLHVYDFQRLYLVLRCEGHTEDIRALHFHFSAALLFSADASGLVFIWQVGTSDTSRYHTHPIMQLSLATTTAFFMTEPRPVSVSGSHLRTSSRPSTGVPTAAIQPSPVTSILSTPESRHGSAYVYVGTMNGAIWGWDFRVLTNHARKSGVGGCFEYRFVQEQYGDGSPIKYNAMLRVNHKTSVLKLHPDDANTPTSAVFGRKGKTRQGKAPPQLGILQSCEATYAWQAHTASVNQLGALPLPGQLFSVSYDGSVKVWDPFHACLGTISTLTKGDSPPQNPITPPTTSNGTPSSSWKFSHHHHMAHEARDQHIRIAREMLRRVKRKPKQDRRNTGNPRLVTPSDQRVDENLEGSDSELGRIDHGEPPELPASLAAAEKLLANHIPFSKESLRAGAQTGLFGVEEAEILRELAQGAHSRSAHQHKPLLAPLVAASPKSQDRHAKKAVSYPNGNEHELPVMRNMRNFPIEVERRRAAEQRTGGGLGSTPDITLSPFLQEKLATPSPTLMKMKQHAAVKNAGPKSTPKRKPPSPVVSPLALSMTMRASVVVTEQSVSLPMIQQTPSQDIPRVESRQENAGLSTRSRLASFASSPCLPTFNPAQAAAPILSHSVSQLSVTTAETGGPGNGALRSNIERKMRLYEGIGTLMIDSQDPEATGAGERHSSPSRFGIKRQTSQPDLTKRPTTQDPHGGSRTASSRKRASQGNVSGNSPLRSSANAASSTPTSNPFGPHYTTKQVMDFGGVIAKYDSDCSGDIDKSEWVQMLQSCRPLFGSSDLEAAERLFHSIDRDDSGKISLQEIMPMMFSKATPEQLQKMLQSIQTHIDKAAAAMAAARSVGMSKLLGR